MTDEYKYKVMLAAEGGMTESNVGREVFPTDSDMALAMGEWILESIKNTCMDDAEVIVTINVEDVE